MPDSLQPVDNVLGARYRYYTVNIVTNTVIGEIPFEDVSYERSVKAPGAFDGKITISDQTSNLDLYNATLPGKTALYVVRNDEAVWGGIIWGRTYDLKGRSLAVSASEFTSYLSHRIIWKTYSHDCSAKLTKATSSSYVLVTIQDKVLKAAPAITDNAGNPNYVTITFSDNAYRKYSGSYKIVGKSSSPAAPANPGRAAFYVDIPALPKKSVGVYDGVGVTLKADTYEFLRDIITSTFSDFTDIEFPNAIIEPGIKIPYELDTKQLTITDDSNGVATITTKSEHDLTAGQRIEIVNVDPMLDGFHTISATPTKYSFQYVLTNPISRHDNVSRVYLDSSLSTPVSLSASVDMVKVRQVVEYLPQYVNYVQRVSGVITATFNSVHTFKKGDKVIVNFEKNGVTEKLEEVKTKNTDGTTTTKKEKVNTFDFKKYNDTVTVTSATANAITFLDPDPDHVSPGYDTKGNVSPSKNSIKNAAPLPLLLLYPQNSSGYNMGDDIRVDGVDDAGWQYPVYDGYHKVYEVSPGKTYSITKYKAESDWLTEDTDDVDDKRVIAYVYCTTDPGIEAGDEFVVSGITGTTALNGTYTALLDSFLDPTYSLYAVPYIKQISAVSITTQASGASLVKNGETWIAYQPGTSELRYSLKNEPDADSGISKFEYTAAKGDKKNVVQITTKSRHGLKIGDTVKIVYGQSDKNVDQETYGGTVKVTAVQDYDTFSYTLIKGKHKKDAPKKDVELTDKSGTVTRLRHGILNPEIVQEEIDSVRTEITAAGATQVTVYAPGHNFKKGDYISVSVNDSNYKGINTEATPKKITSAAGNYFRYISGSPVVEGQTSSLSQIIYSKDGSTVKYKASKFAAAYTAATRTATLLEPNKTTGFVTFTTSVSHGFVVGQKVTVAGFVAPTASSSTTTTRNHTISSVTYDANTKTAIVRFTSAHSLRPLVDVGASFTVAGANKTAVWPSGTTTFPFVDISWLNATHTIVDIPDTTSIAIKYLGLTGNWVVFSGASGVGSPTTVQTVTVTQNVYDPQDLTAFNMTAEVASVPSVTKIALKYPDSSDSALGSSISLTGLGITIQGFASNATTAEQLEAGDFIYISGLTDSGENYYSKLNGDGFKVKSIAAISGDTTNVYVTIANPVRADGKYIKYADKTSGVPSTAKMYRGYDVDGTAYLSPAALESGDTKNNYILTNVARSSGSNTATITIGTHDLTVGDYINVEVFASNQAAFSQNSRDCKITSITDTTISYTMKANNDIEYVSWRAGRATLYFKNSTAGAHNYVVGDVITVSSLPAPFTGYNGTGKTIVATGPFSITYTYSGPTKKVAKTAVTAGSITRTTSQSVNKAVYGIVTRVPAIYKKPIAYARTYGEFPTNANIGGLTFSTNNYSTKNQGTSPIYGSELKTVSEILDQYSNSLTGFDYRIDVSLSTDQNGNKSFSRQFVLIPTYPESLTNYLASLPGGKLAKGQVARPSAFGADKLVFEYPGNISNVSMAEKAENSATRVFVTGSSSKAGDGTETPYAAAADNSLLADNWPLLDKKETVTWPAQGNNSASSTSKTSNTYTDEWGNHDDETDYYASAKRFLAETKPPAGDFVITVNGSLTPVVGSYNPGEWCSIIINDNFVKTRLNSVLEPRKDVIVRKIDAIKVDVPNNPAFPENINLTLVADWQVDSVGK
jgi:hypothetical protein